MGDSIVGRQSAFPNDFVLMTRPDRSLNPATLAGLSPCSLNVCRALPNEPSCPAIGLRSRAWVPARCALSMSSQLYLWRYSPALPMIDAIENP
jgi:hypothetical protein